MAQPCQNRCRQIQATKTASIGLAYDFLRFLRLPQGKTCVASPIYKQHFDLLTGQCLEDETVSIKIYPVKIEGEAVLIAA